MAKPWHYMVAAGLVLAGTEASAADSNPCPSGLICASDPKGVAAALQELGYKAALGKDGDDGRPKISSAANGYNFTV